MNKLHQEQSALRPDKGGLRPVRIPVLVFAVCLVALASTTCALADGMMLPPYWVELYEHTQTAFLRHVEGTEELTILPKFTGPPTDFAWVVPVPAIPEVDEGDPDLFRNLADLSRPRYRSRDSFWNCQDDYEYVVSPDLRDGVQIIDEELVGIYSTMILGADDSQALVDSLTAWGFLHEGNVDEVTPLLDSYVERDWYFVTMKIDSTAFHEEYIYPEYYYGALEPVTFTFASDDPVYPLRISSVSAYRDSEVFLYVAADHRMTYPGMDTDYANRISAGELAALRREYPSAAAHLDEGVFLTKLHRRYTPEEMTEDLVLVRAANDNEYLPLIYSGLPLTSVLLGGSLLGWFVVRRKKQVQPVR